jgi:3-hydroxy-3-methylglutaryl CoA synthase
MATTSHALTNPNAALYAAFAAQPDTTTAAARVVEHLIQQDPDAAFPEAQRARREAEDALALIRGFLEAGPDLRALTLVARDAAAFVAQVEARS